MEGKGERRKREGSRDFKEKIAMLGIIQNGWFKKSSRHLYDTVVSGLAMKGGKGS